MATPKNDIDEEVIWLGTGAATPIEGKPKKLQPRNPIGFIWPKMAKQRKPRATSKRRNGAGRKQ